MSYKIAVASSNGRDIDLHFGHVSGFYIIEVDEEKEVWSLLEYRDIPTNFDRDGIVQRESHCNGHDEIRLLKIAELLGDCPYLFTSKIGIRPYRILKRNGVSPLEIQGRLEDVIDKFYEYYRRQNLSKEGTK